ncbi:MAG TPA: enoyl-CoA hydratase/isomerase family protein [Acidimicrobiia bacterium]|nr:enoyl-CoA hydratase/isomerase family protein [Acidimicrobiia bacterium]
MPFELTRREDVFILTMDEGDNRFNEDSLGRLGEILDEVEAAEGPAALVTTGTGKFYSNGLDLDWIMAGNSDWTFADLAIETQRLFARTLTFRRPTVAAINGHCFAAGAMWSLAHDFRVMRADRGFWSMPEVDIRIPFTPGMSALIQARLRPQVAHRVMTTAHRYGGNEAMEAGIVDQAVDEHYVLNVAIEMAAALAGKDPDTSAAIKTGMYKPVIEALTT